MKVFELVSKNDFTKIFKSYDVELFISKAYDDDEKKREKGYVVVVVVVFRTSCNF